jgi:shikimate dehydrogenase
MASVESGPDRYALVGHPVDHSRSPLIHRLFARQTGQSLTYELIDAEPASFEAAVRGFFAAGGRGMNVTVPHKGAAFELADAVSPRAQAARAVNTLVMTDGLIRGDNTDGVGFIRDLLVNQRQPLEARSVLVLGAGGAARGIVGPVLDAGPREVLIGNRTIARAEELVEQFRGDHELGAIAFSDLDTRGPFDVVVNATAAGLKGDATPFPGSLVGPTTFCYDLVYSLRDTPFVEWAKQHGARRAVQGWGMLVEQAAESFLIWRGIRPDTAAVLKQMPR